MFNNGDSKTNGEYLFLTKIAPHINTIFDVGCRKDTEFTQFNGVHYFDPVKEFIDELKSQPTSNSKAYYNAFGLGNKDEEIDYFPSYQSFFNRTVSCRVSDEASKRKLKIRRAADYIQENSEIQTIDFLKIDTEGFEFEVLKGFDTYLKRVNYIQFEYGGTFMDNGVKLKDVIDYLSDRGFVEFSYLTGAGMHPITDFTDHYQYCNIVCRNSLL